MADFLSNMETLYEAMQRDYDSVREHYGFSCKGCVDNCCTQRFFHYTWAEYLYLLEGMKNAGAAVSMEIIGKAREVVASYDKEEDPSDPKPLMCPINFEGLCALYTHRPMICRMHGLPHRVRDPKGRETRGGGCAPFDSKAIKAGWTLNRTPHYLALARVEGELRARRKLSAKLRLTTAEMLIMMATSGGGAASGGGLAP
ncbi:hypothetical protein LCGC14_1881220, partial [marine sediment metagenome]